MKCGIAKCPVCRSEMRVEFLFESDQPLPQRVNMVCMSCWWVGETTYRISYTQNSIALTNGNKKDCWRRISNGHIYLPVDCESWNGVPSLIAVCVDDYLESPYRCSQDNWGNEFVRLVKYV